MRRAVVNLVLNLTILICWSIVGIKKSNAEPLQMCMYSVIVTTYLYMLIEDIRYLLKLFKKQKANKGDRQ